MFVKFPPRFVDGQNFEDKIKEVQYGNSVDLHCETDANPTPHITWAFNGKSTGKYNEERLKLENVDEVTEGEYECQVENPLGRVKRSFVVKIRPKGKEENLSQTSK
jgi:hypothetical protein